MQVKAIKGNKAAQNYFKLTDQGRPEVLELFHDDAEIYVQKCGLGCGRESLFEVTGVGRHA